MQDSKICQKFKKKSNKMKVFSPNQIEILTLGGPMIMPVQWVSVISSSFSKPQEMVPSPKPFWPCSNSSRRRKFLGTTAEGMWKRKTWPWVAKNTKKEEWWWLSRLHQNYVTSSRRTGDSTFGFSRNFHSSKELEFRRVAKEKRREKNKNHEFSIQLELTHTAVGHFSCFSVFLTVFYKDSPFSETIAIIEFFRFPSEIFFNWFLLSHWLLFLLCSHNQSEKRKLWISFSLVERIKWCRAIELIRN